MLKAIHQHARFGQQMVDLNTNLTVIIYYRMYPTLFRRKEQTWKRLRVGLRTDDNIPKNAAISLKRSHGCCYCCNYLLGLSVQRLGMVRQTLLHSVCVVGTIAYGNFISVVRCR
jgi:hypothetical protein